MAKTVTTTLVDDLDGSDAAETVPFMLDRQQYEIDLNSANAARLRAALAEFVANGRRTGGRKITGAPGAPGAPGAVDHAEVRAWANSHGHQLAARGRIPGHVLAEFTQAQAATGGSGKGKSRRAGSGKASGKAAATELAATTSGGTRSGGKTRKAAATARARNETAPAAFLEPGQAAAEGKRGASADTARQRAAATGRQRAAGSAAGSKTRKRAAK